MLTFYLYILYNLDIFYFASDIKTFFNIDIIKCKRYSILKYYYRDPLII